MTSNILGTKEVWERLRAEGYDVSYSAARGWVYRGLFPGAVRRGWAWVITEEDFEAALAKFEPPTAGRPGWLRPGTKQAVKALLAAGRLSQAEIARRCNVSASYVSHVKRGRI
jgi:hypothetical protein